MSLVLNTNLNSLVAQNALTSSGSSLASALQQLSTGLAINTAADNAAGYAIVQGMTSQINGLNTAVQNANDGAALTQTASGALSEIVNDLQTMRDLAVQSLNATNSSQDRADLNQQFQQLKADINNVAQTTQFNGVNLLDGTFNGATFQIGANVGQTITVSSVASASASALGVYTGVNQTNQAVTYAAGTSAFSVTVNGNTTNLGTIGTDAASIAAAINSGGVQGLTATANATSYATNATAVTGAAGDGDSFQINGVTVNVTNTGNAASNVAAAVTAINAVSADTGVVATSNGAGVTLSAADGRTITVGGFVAGGAATIADYGLTAGSQTGTVNIDYVAPAGVGGNLVFAGAGFGQTYAVGTTGNSVQSLDVLTVPDSNKVLTSIDAALQQLAATGAQLGAYQNRFQAAVTGLSADATNLASARSQIRDTNYAQETSQLSKSQILQQASTAMVAQANLIPQNILTLLQKLP